MRFTAILCFWWLVLSFQSQAQQPEYWRRYVAEGNSENRASGDLLLRLNESIGVFDADLRGRNILRVIDERTVIIASGDRQLISKNLGEWYEANNLWKISENILKETFFGRREFLIHFLSNDILSQLNPDVEVLSLNHSYRIIRVKCARKHLFELAQNPDVRFISQESGSPTTDSRVLDLNLNPNGIPRARSLAPGVTGSKLTVSVQERKFDANDLDLIGRVVETGYEFESSNNHATDMATIIGGAGNSFVTGAGVVPDVSLTSSSFAEVLPMPDGYYTDYDIVVQNHSYGTIQEGFYGIQAAAYDKSMHSNEQLLHVISSGNIGVEPAADGPYAGVEGFANLTGNFKMAKNPLVIGAVDTVGGILDYSSRGPAFDGRIKPDLVAYSIFGSSNATALVSGVSAMLQEQHLNTYGNYAPSALVKALLIAGADDLDDPGPDHIRGHGNVNAGRSMQLLQKEQFVTGEMDTNGPFTFPITLAKAANLRIALVWTDPPAKPGDARALINDLDVKLKTPDGKEVLPWVLKTSANAQALSESATKGEDHLNTVEVISLDGALAGTYTVSITASQLLSPSQQFYVVYRIDEFEQFEWEYPVAGSVFPYNGETGTYFRWASTLSNTTGQLQVNSNDSGWMDVGSSIDLAQGNLRWEPDPSMAGKAVARMLIGGKTFHTDTFLLSRSHRVSVGLNCGDSVLVQWPKDSFAHGYEVQTLSGSTMHPILQTEDTLVLLQQNQLATGWIKVQPIWNGAHQPLPSAALRYEDQGAGCLIQSFYQEVVLDTGVFLNVRLGTTYGVKSMRIYDLRKSEIEPFFEVTNPDQKHWRVQQQQPTQGHNRHRVTLELANGQRLEEETQGSYYLTELPLVVFPNPVPQNDFLQVYLRAFDEKAVFELIDGSGNRVYRKQLLLSQVSIPLYGLLAGLYTYRLHVGEETFSGKILIE